MDLLDGDRIQPALDNAEDGGESPWGVDEVHLAQSFWVVVLGHGGRLTDVGVHGGYLSNSNSLHIHDCATCFKEAACLSRAGWETWIADFLVFDGEVLQHALGGGDLVHGGQIDFAHLLNVDGASILSVC